MKNLQQAPKPFADLEAALSAQLKAAPAFETAARALLETTSAVGKAAAEAGINPPERSRLINRMSRCIAQAGIFEPSDFLDRLKDDHAEVVRTARG